MLAAQQDLIVKVYACITFALVITGVVAYLISTSPEILQYIFKGSSIFLFLMIFEFILLIGLSSILHKINTFFAIFLFVLFSVVNGLNLSIIFKVYTQSSISFTLYVVAITFGCMSIYGHYTKRDLTSWKSFLLMTLVGLLIATLANLYFNTAILYWITSFVAVLAFIILTALYVYEVKNMVDENGLINRKAAVIGALFLYLGFMSLFLTMLRISGNKK